MNKRKCLNVASFQSKRKVINNSFHPLFTGPVEETPAKPYLTLTFVLFFGNGQKCLRWVDYKYFNGFSFLGFEIEILPINDSSCTS